MIFSFVLLILSWCWSSLDSEWLAIDISGFNLQYNWSVKLKKVYLKNDDLDEITDLYEEVWDNLEYRDSLLVAERYWQWLWINGFAQDNLDTLEDHWLVLWEIKKTQIKIKKDNKKFDSVLVDYKISEWLIEDIPVIYVSQLFVPQWTTVLLISYISEDMSARDNMSKAFKNLN